MESENLELKSPDHVAITIERLRQFEPPEGYWLAFSGGKDSQCIYHLAQEAGVKFTAHFNVSLEPPELKQFIRQQYPDVVWERMPGFNFYTKLAEKGFPIRQHRWCCEYMKEWGGAGHVVVTGVRWAESSARKRNRRLVDTLTKSRMLDQPKVCVNPIIDWTTGQVWDYLRSRGKKWCSLYDEGFKRLGCVLCPMCTSKEKRREEQRWPKIALAWEHAFERLYARRISQEKKSVKRWKNAHEMYRWYIDEPETIPAEQACFAFE